MLIPLMHCLTFSSAQLEDRDSNAFELFYKQV